MHMYVDIGFTILRNNSSRKFDENFVYFLAALEQSLKGTAGKYCVGDEVRWRVFFNPTILIFNNVAVSIVVSR